MDLRDRMTSLKARVPHRLKAPIKDLYGGALTWANRHAHAHYSSGQTILVVGSPRSGTTWLMSLVCSIPGACPIFEPLKRDEEPLLRSGVVPEWLDLPRSAPAEELEAYLELVFRGHRLTRWSSNYASLARLLTARRYVVKFVRATRSLGWLSERFPEQRKVLVLRHPCAVVSSMLRSPGIWQEWTPGEVLDPIAPRFPAEVDVLRRLPASPEMLLAAFWSADSVASLSDTRPDEVHVVTYEELVDGERARLEALYAHVDERLPSDWSRALRRPSLTATPGAAVRSGKDPLAPWRERLEPQQVARILEVVETFGIDFYTDASRPALQRLSNYPRLPRGS